MKFTRYGVPYWNYIVIVYYQLFGDASILQSRQAFDSEDHSIGRVPRNKVKPPHTAGIVKRYIAQLEGFDPSQVGGIFFNPEDSGDAIPDDQRLPTEDGARGTAMDLPLAVAVTEREVASPIQPAARDVNRNTGPPTAQTNRGRGPPTPVTPLQGPSSGGGESVTFRTSPFALPVPQLPLELRSPPSPAVSLAPSGRSTGEHTSGSENASGPDYASGPWATATPGAGLSTQQQRPGTTTGRRDTADSTFANPGANRRLRWTIDETGFAEPLMSPTEADKVVSSKQPPGWLSGRINFLGMGLFMGKLGRNSSLLISDTVLRNGMRIWVDARTLRSLRLRTGDTCKFHLGVDVILRYRCEPRA